MKKSILFLGLCMLALNANAQTLGGKAKAGNNAKNTNVEMAKPSGENQTYQPHVLSLIKAKEDFNFDDYLTQNLKTSNGEKLDCKKQNEVVVCFDKNQKPFTGVATGIANNPKIKFTGHANYKNGMLNGLSKIVYKSGNVAFESKYVNGKREGVSVTYSDKGYKQSETNYKNGKKDGRFVAYFPNGAKMVEANYKNDKAEGTQRVWHPNGKLQSQARFSNDLIEGNATTYYTSGRIETQRTYKNGKENGVMKIYDDKKNKVTAQIPYVDGKIHGMLIVYNDGIPFNEMHYENGINNGKYILYHKNGKKFIVATAKNDKLEGEAKVYDKTGKLQKIEYYKDGKIVKK